MTQAEVRQRFIKANPGVTRVGKRGKWYRCACCGKWCGRPGNDRVNIKDSEKMEVDHIRPWSQGGSDELWNLQPLCKPCNRKKLATPTTKDKLKMVKNDILHGDGVKAAVKKPFRQMGISKRK
jgi:5-methylcytosine-specific restriction endonuclease McrA